MTAELRDLLRCVLGFTMAPLGDGLVIPKMKDFAKPKLQNAAALPKAVFTVAPLEMATCIFLHGVCVDLARDEGPAVGVLLGFVALKFFGTLLHTFVVAYVTASVVHSRDKVTLLGKKVFANTNVEELIIVTAVVLLTFRSSHRAGLGPTEWAKGRGWVLLSESKNGVGSYSLGQRMGLGPTEWAKARGWVLLSVPKDGAPSCGLAKGLFCVLLSAQKSGLGPIDFAMEPAH